LPTECISDLNWSKNAGLRPRLTAEQSRRMPARRCWPGDKALRLPDRFASCFHEGRSAADFEHGTVTLVKQRVFGKALRYEDLLDHDQLRHEPVLAAIETPSVDVFVEAHDAAPERQPAPALPTSRTGRLTCYEIQAILLASTALGQVNCRLCCEQNIRPAQGIARRSCSLAAANVAKSDQFLALFVP
jgi:hypothetical protein